MRIGKVTLNELSANAQKAILAMPKFSARRLVIAGGFVAAVAAAPVIGTLAIASGTAPAVAACPAGETEDLFTGVCVPDVVPNSPETETSPGGLPDAAGVPCTGANTGKCIGLSESEQGPIVTPHSSVSSSP